ncbi:MAG: AAA family ATPase [Chloroflexota bacterium]
MRIDRLSIRNLGRLRSTDLTIGPGLTVVRGPNEAGKSTVARAVELALAGSVTTPPSDLADLVPWGGAPGDVPAVDITFGWEDDAGTAHTGRAAKSFGPAGAGSARLQLDAGPVITVPAQVDAELAAITGLEGEPILRASASVGHHELVGLDRGDGVVGERLAAMISGADRATARARLRLGSELDLLRGGDRGPGRLKVAEDAVADAASRLAHGEEGLARLVRDREARTATRERRAEAEAALLERRALLEKARLAERLTAERATAAERLERYRAAVDLRDEVAVLDASHPSAAPVTVLRAGVERLRAVDTQIATLELLLVDDVHVSFDLAPEVSWKGLSRTAMLLVVAGVLGAVAGFVAGAAGIAGLVPVVPAGGALVAVLGAVLAVVARRRHAANRTDKRLRDEEVARRLRGRSDIESELKFHQAERATMLESLGFEGTAPAEAVLAAEEAHVATLGERRARLAGLVGDEPRDTLDLRRDTAALDVARASTALDDLGPIAREPNARARLEVEVSDAEGVVSRSRDDDAAANARVEQNTTDADEIAGLAERLAGWRAQLATLRRRERILARTLAEIDAAEASTMSRATRFLERRMAADVARLTGGRYREVRIRDHDLGIELLAPERGDWVPAARLSQGTLDIVYLAARLGLVRYLAADRRPPILLDDPLAGLDDARADHVLALLRGLAPDQQVLLFTTSDRYDTRADRVVVLDGPPEGPGTGGVAPA